MEEKGGAMICILTCLLILDILLQGGTRLRRSVSTGSGDKVQNRNFENVSTVQNSGLAQVMETFPDILTGLVITNKSSSVINNNQAVMPREEAAHNDIFEDDMADFDESFDPGALGLLENPGIVRFDSLDYPEFCDCLSEADNEADSDESDGFDSSDGTGQIFHKLLRFSCDSLIGSSSNFKKQKFNQKKRTKSLSDLYNLESCQLNDILFRERWETSNESELHLNLSRVVNCINVFAAQI